MTGVSSHITTASYLKHLPSSRVPPAGTHNKAEARLSPQGMEASNPHNPKRSMPMSCLIWYTPSTNSGLTNKQRINRVSHATCTAHAPLSHLLPGLAAASDADDTS